MSLKKRIIEKFYLIFYANIVDILDMEIDQKIYIVSVAVIAIVIGLYYFKNISNTIPIVVIARNNLFFVRNFMNQLKKYENPIIIFDNNSTYAPMFDFYKEIKEEFGSKIDIRQLDINEGCGVASVYKDNLPPVFILSDPDLQLNPRMPANFSDIMLDLSNKYGAYKVGLALDISEPDKLLPCKKYDHGKTIYEWESRFWKKKIKEDTWYELYDAPTDTTFCLINRVYPETKQIRIAGDFTAKHLPWYNGFLKKHIPKDEFEAWKEGNNSSSILKSCITD